MAREHHRCKSIALLQRRNQIRTCVSKDFDRIRQAEGQQGLGKDSIPASAPDHDKQCQGSVGNADRLEGEKGAGAASHCAEK